MSKYSAIKFYQVCRIGSDLGYCGHAHSCFSNARDCLKFKGEGWEICGMTETGHKVLLDEHGCVK